MDNRRKLYPFLWRKAVKTNGLPIYIGMKLHGPVVSRPRNFFLVRFIDPGLTI